MNKILSIFFVLMLVAGSAWGANWYVSPSGTGDGTAVGTSMDVSDLNGKTLSNNDVVIFKSEVTYNAQITLASLNASNITLRASESTDGDWGDGTKDKDNGANFTGYPTIDGDAGNYGLWINNSNLNGITIQHLRFLGLKGLSTVTGAIFRLSPLGDVVIDGVVVDGEAQANNYRKNGMQFVNHAGMDGGDITVKNCTIQNIMLATAATTKTAWTENDAVGLIFWFHENSGRSPKTSGTVNIHDNTIQNCYSDLIHLAGIQTTTNVYDNTLSGFAENAVDMKACVDVNIYRNDMDWDDYETSDSGNAGPSFIATGSHTEWPTCGTNCDTTGIDIYDNYFHDLPLSGINLGLAEGARVYRNYFKDVFQPITIIDKIYVYNNKMDCSADLIDASYTVDGNSLRNTSTWQYGSKRYAIWTHGDFTQINGSVIENNTIYVNHATYTGAISVNGRASTAMTFRNNIIYCTTSGDYAFEYDGDGLAPTVVNNSYYNSGGTSNWIKWDTTYYGSGDQATFRSAQDAGAVFGDPGIDITSNRFYPDASGDACVDAGATPTYATSGLDDDSSWTSGVATVIRADHGTGPDIGAYEFETVDPPTAENDFSNDPNCIAWYELQDPTDYEDSKASYDLGTAGQVGDSGTGTFGSTGVTLAGNQGAWLAEGTFSEFDTDFCVVADFKQTTSAANNSNMIITAQFDWSDTQRKWQLKLWDNPSPSSDDDDVVVFIIGEDDDTFTSLESTYGLTLNTRYVAVACWDDSEDDGFIYIYEQGNSSVQDTFSDTSVFDAADQFVGSLKNPELAVGVDIGNDDDGASFSFVGTIYEVAITSDILDATERGEIALGEYSNPQGSVSSGSCSDIVAAGTHRITLVTDREIFVTDAGNGFPYFTVALDYGGTATYTYAGKSSTDSYWDATISAGDRQDSIVESATITVPTNTTMVDSQDNDISTTISGIDLTAQKIAVPTTWTSAVGSNYLVDGDEIQTVTEAGALDLSATDGSSGSEIDVDITGVWTVPGAGLTTGDYYRLTGGGTISGAVTTGTNCEINGVKLE